MKSPNWKTVGAAVGSLLVTISLAPELLGDLGVMLPAEWRKAILLAAAVAAFFLRLAKAWGDQKPPTPPAP